MVSDNIKVYTFSGFPFEQRVLTYPEFEQAVALLGNVTVGIDEKSMLGAVLEHVIKSGAVPQLVRLVIKPRHATWLHALYYWMKRRITKTDLSDPIKLMDLNEVIQVVRDFFTINTSSLSNLKDFGIQSGLFPIHQLLEMPLAPRS